MQVVGGTTKHWQWEVRTRGDELAGLDWLIYTVQSRVLFAYLN